jgi:anti-anti-sigma factor
MSDDQAPFAFRIEGGVVDGASIIVIDGELDLVSAPHLVEAMSNLAEGREPVVLDLSSVTFVDSSGVRALLDVERIVGDKGRRLALFRPGVGVTRLLDLVDLRSRFTEVEALDSDTLLALHRL